MDCRPWDDPEDPRPPVHAPDGSWPNPDFVAWAKRSGHRRWVYMGFDEPQDPPPVPLVADEKMIIERLSLGPSPIGLIVGMGLGLLVWLILLKVV